MAKWSFVAISRNDQSVGRRRGYFDAVAARGITLHWSEASLADAFRLLRDRITDCAECLRLMARRKAVLTRKTVQETGNFRCKDVPGRFIDGLDGTCR